MADCMVESRKPFYDLCALFSMTLKAWMPLNPDFKGTPLFDVDYYEKHYKIDTRLLQTGSNR